MGARVKITRIGSDEIFHRYLTPKWAFLPTSGAGAAIDGGRFNRPDVEALYLSRAPQTALEEYKQGASITPPATLAAYKITRAEVDDLSQGFDPNARDGAWREWDCAWRQISRISGKIPPSWKLADWSSWLRERLGERVAGMPGPAPKDIPIKTSVTVSM
jgi:RES domain-containing protein